MSARTFIIATRGSPLALAQAHQVLNYAHKECPDRRFELRIFKTTGDQLQSTTTTPAGPLSKGLFTKELEQALLNREADVAVHSLKDYPRNFPMA